MGKKRIGELLVEGGWVTPEAIKEALKVQKSKGGRIGKILIDLGHLTEEHFLEFLGSMPSIPTVDLAGCEIEREIIDLVPEEIACRLELVPIGKIGKILTVGMVYPLDEAGKKELEQITGLKIRAVLCSRTAVLSGLQRYYRKDEEVPVEFTLEEEEPLGSEAAAKLGAVTQIIEEIEELPTLPDILRRISFVVGDPKSSAKDLAQVIATDTALTGKILRLANSPAYGFSRRITSIAEAVTLIGFRETQELAISVSVFDHLNFRAEFNFRSYWKHSLECATLARLISRGLKPGGLESAFISGLLHDMGKVVLARKAFKDRAAGSLPFSATDTIRLKLEEVAFGVNHAETGYLLAEHWLLPDIVASAIRYHHAPESEPTPSVPSRLVFLANAMSKRRPEEYEKEYEFDERQRGIIAGLELSEASVRAALKSYAKTASEIPSL